MEPRSRREAIGAPGAAQRSGGGGGRARARGRGAGEGTGTPMIFTAGELTRPQLRLVDELEGLWAELRAAERRRLLSVLDDAGTPVAPERHAAPPPGDAGPGPGDAGPGAGAGAGAGAQAEDPDAQADMDGFRRARADALEEVTRPGFRYSSAFLRRMHRTMMGHRPGKGPGRWRTRPVYVYGNRRVIYEPPPRILVPTLVGELVAYLNSRDGDRPPVRAALAHLNVGAVHPFADGNSRMARVVQSAVLARGSGLPAELCGIEEQVIVQHEAGRRAMKRVRGATWDPGRPTARWIDFCLRAGVTQAHLVLGRIRASEAEWAAACRIVDTGRLPRRAAVALAMASASGDVTSTAYAGALGISTATARADLHRLAEHGALVASTPGGGGRTTVYRPGRGVPAGSRTPEDP